MSVVGIDFGSEYLIIGAARRAGIDILQNDIGKRKTYAGVSYGREQRFIADDMTSQFLSNSVNSIIYLKRLLGLQWEDPAVQYEQQYIPCKLINDNGRIAVEVKHLNKVVKVTPEQAVATLLTKLQHVYEINSEGQKMKDCVIAVPPYFNDTQRKAMLNAAKMAGLNVLRLINETTAVAVQYGLTRTIEDTRQVVFFDVGQCNTNACLATFTPKGVTINKYVCSKQLGGRDFDEVIAKYLNEQFKAKYKKDLYENPKSLLKLRQHCAKIKQTLSANSKVDFSMEYIVEGIDFIGSITRKEFDDLIEEHLFKKLIAPLNLLLDGVNKETIHSIEIVGGTTRIPYIQNTLKKEIGRELSKTCDADESVCRGATLQCAMISPSFKVKEYEVKDITTSGIVINYNGNNVISLLNVNDHIPALKTVSFKEFKLPFEFTVQYQKNSTTVDNTDVFAKFTVTAPKDMVLSDREKVLKIKCRVDGSSIFSVTSAYYNEEVEVVEEPTTTPMTDNVENNNNGDNNNASTPSTNTPTEPKVSKVMKKMGDLIVTSEYKFDLSDDEIRKATDQEASMAYQDRIVRETSEAKNNFEAYILNMKPRISDDLKDFFPPGVGEQFYNTLKSEEEWLDDEGYDEKKEVYVERLNKLKVIGDAALEKFNDIEKRNEAKDLLTNELNKWQQLANSSDEKFSHIEFDERKKIINKCLEISSWLSKSLSDQEKMKKYDTPVITSSQINSKIMEIKQFAYPIMNKPKPAPKKEEPKKEEPKKEEPKKEEAKKDDNAKSEENKAEDNKTEDSEKKPEA